MNRIYLIAIILILSACGRIETGNVGVRTEFNKTILKEEVTPGIYGAFLTSVDEYIAKETELSLNDMQPKAKDNLTLLDLDVSIFYTVNPTLVADFEIKYTGMSKEDEETSNLLPGYKLVQRVARGAVYDSIAQYESLTIHTKRTEIEQSILQKIQQELNESDKDTFAVQKVVIRQVTTDPELEQSIQAAVQMQKKVEAKINELELAKAEAQRKKVEAEGIAVANKLIAASITPDYVQYRQIEAMEKFAGGEGTHTVVLPSGMQPFVSIK